MSQPIPKELFELNAEFGAEVPGIRAKQECIPSAVPTPVSVPTHHTPFGMSFLARASPTILDSRRASSRASSRPTSVRR